MSQVWEGWLILLLFLFILKGFRITFLGGANVSHGQADKEVKCKMSRAFKQISQIRSFTTSTMRRSYDGPIPPGDMAQTLRSLTVRIKPPNILIHGPRRHFERLKTLLGRRLASDSYTIYPLTSQACGQGHWLEQTRLLINTEATPDGAALTRMRIYANEWKGHFLHLNPVALNLEEVTWSSISTPEDLVTGQCGPSIWCPQRAEDLAESLLVHILAEGFHFCDLDQVPEAVPALTPGFLYCRRAHLVTQARQNLDLTECESVLVDVKRLNQWPIVHQESPLFNGDLYFDHLDTNSLGQTLVFAPVVKSTFDLLQRQVGHGYVVLALRQLQGQGRGGNVWLSPRGCLMFSLQMILSLRSRVGQHLPLLQHLMGLALVHTVNTRIDSGPKLRLKWPNDIYWGDQVKMGGVLTNTSIQGDGIVINIGLGFNLDNSQPTQSLNHILAESSQDCIAAEVLVAQVLQCFENLIQDLEAGKVSELIHLYQTYWLHSHQAVQVQMQDSDEVIQVQIDSIDEFGFLLARRPDGQMITLHPDGNSFDMLKGLIFPKSNLPFSIQNRFALTAKFILFLGSGFTLPFIVVRHQLKK
eukprot:snap_masked-scaffold180_size281610-processed-gene-1.22 protein:Tk11877 transcript:snap_masked-scaffold180_size281610-processed-gene-1.22-mRNA-1 annotation:"biotin--protein ligase"